MGDHPQNGSSQCVVSFKKGACKTGPRRAEDQTLESDTYRFPCLLTSWAMSRQVPSRLPQSERRRAARLGGIQCEHRRVHPARAARFEKEANGGLGFAGEEVNRCESECPPLHVHVLSALESHNFVHTRGRGFPHRQARECVCVFQVCIEFRNH